MNYNIFGCKEKFKLEKVNSMQKKCRNQLIIFFTLITGQSWRHEYVYHPPRRNHRSCRLGEEFRESNRWAASSWYGKYSGCLSAEIQNRERSSIREASFQSEQFLYITMIFSLFSFSIWKRDTGSSIFRCEPPKRAFRTLRVWTQNESENKCCIFARAVSESPVWPHVSHHSFL